MSDNNYETEAPTGTTDDAMGGILSGGTKGSVGGFGKMTTQAEEGEGGSGTITTGDEGDIGGDGTAGGTRISGHGAQGPGGIGNMGSANMPTGPDTQMGTGTSSMDD